MTANTLDVEQQVCFQFKASFLPCAVLQINRYDLEEIERQLVATICHAPNLFTGSPVVIDLDKIKTCSIFNFAKLKHILIMNGMVPIGVRGGSEEQRQAAVIDGLPILSASKLNMNETKKKKPDEKTFLTKLVTSPVRSGMQIYAKESDLIVTAAVSSGAELFSDGNIHVYGVLRGRALAGVQGNKQARIFCRTLEAELVSIAGYYLTREDMQTSARSDGMVQIYLDNAQIRIETIK